MAIWQPQIDQSGLSGCHLVVLRMVGGGYDGPSGIAADARGYLHATLSLFKEIYDIHRN
jgi:hypothetical protein